LVEWGRRVWSNFQGGFGQIFKEGLKGGFGQKEGLVECGSQIFNGHENMKICTAYEIQAAPRVKYRQRQGSN
jgi:hypothetical protein